MMQQTPPVLDAVLTSGTRHIDVKARFASAHSILVEVEDGIGEDIEGLSLRMDGKTIDLGPCRLIREPLLSDPLRRAIPACTMFDFRSLFFRAHVESITAESLGLTLMLRYKDDIDPSFKNYVTDITYDINTYKNRLDRLDAENENEPANVREVVENHILNGMGAKLMTYLDTRLDDLKNITRNFNAIEHEHHGFYFRRQLWNVLLNVPIMARTNLKPRGYAGDAEMMRMIYQNGYEGDSMFGRILHKHAMAQPAAQAVRNRRASLANTFHAHVNAPAHQGTGTIRVLSVACGPAYEIGDILRTPDDAARIHFSLLDQDQQALVEADCMVRTIEKTIGVPVAADFIRESVRTMLSSDKLMQQWGSFHFIYSMGLFDYLTAPTAAAVLKKLYHLLKPGGKAVIGNFRVDNPSRYFMEYWLDWKIILRSEDELMQLAAGIPGAEVSAHCDDTNIQLFLHIKKPADAG
ncbi:MAG: class I SAM-dependent methyltransferase [Spirochaetota bacterium]